MNDELTPSHTPGPWKAECIGVSDFGPNGVDVYEITNGYTRITEAVFDRDAALIAAAPDLLKALRQPNTALRCLSGA